MRWIVFICVVFVLSCNDYSDIEEVELRTGDPEFAIPLVHASVSLESIFNETETEDTELIIYPDNSMSLIYSGDVLMQMADDILPPLPGNLPFQVTQKMDTVTLLFQRLDIRKASLTGDKLTIGAASNHPGDVNVHVDFLSLTKDGDTLTFDIPLEYDGSLPVENTAMAELDGLTLDLYENSFIIRYEATDEDGNEVDLEYLQFLWNEMTYDYMEGYFSKNTVNIPGDAIDIEVYEQWITGRLYFEDPTVEVIVDNSFGIPVRAQVNKLRFVGRQNQIDSLESPQNDSINFLYPDLDEVGEVKKNVIEYNSNNSNIEDIINIQPRRLEYDIDAIGNPDEDSTIIGFLTDSSFIRINVRVELPLSGWANDFAARDTLDFEIEKIDEIKNAEFKMVFSNGMPLELTSQVYLTDADYEVIDSMFIGELLTVGSPDVNAEGEAVGQRSTIRFETFSSERLDALDQVRHAILEVGFLTKDAPQKSVTITSEDILDFRVGAKFKFK